MTRGQCRVPSDQRHRQENFPVASWLCPPALRPPILAIYRFARTADDLADEGQANPAARLAALARMREQLQDLPHRVDTAAAWTEALAEAIRAHALPKPLLLDLLSAFEQDCKAYVYLDRADLIDYCRRSANPVGRLLLHLVGVNDADALRQSDAICTALQLINHWQDLGVDIRKPRLYLPASDLARHGVEPAAVIRGEHSAALAACVAELLDWAVSLLNEGRPLPRRVGGRLGLELRLVIEGGHRVAERIRAMQHATLLHRPRLRAWDAPLLLARALRYRDGAQR
ncbi:squalene synthase HpnC [Inhella sp.]|uniref:squalene synthase HpnC n=1 Tax=Inhella sp. TaxID=1921806 RepID=UPI0035B2337A